MIFNAEESMFRSVTAVNESAGRYLVCFDAPPHIVSDGLWGGQQNGRTPMKSFLPLFELQVLLIFSITQICLLLIKPLGIPLFISQMMAGLILQGCFVVEPLGTYMRKLFPYGTHDVISTISSIGFVLFIFINGVQMDVGLISRMGKRAWTIGLAALVLPLTCVSIVMMLLGDDADKYFGGYWDKFMVALGSHTVVSFPVIASLLNELEIQNSELGKLALSSALVSDVICTGFTSMGTALSVVKDGDGKSAVLSHVLPLLAMAILIPLLCRPAMQWIIKRTPEGRPVKDTYIYLIILMVFVLGWVSVEIKQEFVLGAFILGLSVPEGPPLGSALVKKLNFFGTTFLLPIFVTTNMLKVDFTLNYYSLRALSIGFVVLFTHFIKIIACFVPALYYNMPMSDALSLALILNSKGIVEIGIYCYLNDKSIIDGETFGIMIVSIMVIASIVKWSVKVLYDPSRKFAGYQKRNVIILKAWSELKMVVCIHKQHHIWSMINVLDLCGPTAENPIVVEVLHLVELVGRAVPIFIPHRLQRLGSGFQKSYSDDIILAFDNYERDNPNAVTANPCTAISPPNLMYEDVCNLAFDKSASIIILPFHQRWSLDGGVESDDKNTRALNIKVLELAPCSVGILVTRSSSLQIREQSSSTTTRLAMIYLGGQDDEEALCICKRANRNPGITLVVYHLVLKEEYQELIVDDDDDDDELQQVKNAQNVRYEQIVTTEGSETAAFLSEVVKEHDFFIVGRRHGIDSPQTEGLTEWSEFPELGAVGDFLASPDLETRASILVVQQQLSPVKHGWLF